MSCCYMTYVMLYNMCCFILYNMCFITYVLLCYITCAICHVMLYNMFVNHSFRANC